MPYIVNVEGAVRHGDRYLLIVRGAEETHAAGDLSLIGGKVEGVEAAANVLEETIRREIREEVGIEVGPQMTYLYSSQFTADDGDVVVDIVFLCEYASGTPRILDRGEVADVLWLTAAEVEAHPRAQPWTRLYIQKAEAIRLSGG